MLTLGAVMLGEVGGGVTLGGGGMDYLYIPLAIKERTGMDLKTRQCRALKEAAMGRYINPDDCDLAEVQRVLDETGLAKHLTAEEARDLVFCHGASPL